MDIIAFKNIKASLKAYNDSLPQNYGNTIVSLPPENPEYPLTRVNEIRNLPNSLYDTPLDRVASIGIRVIIDAKDKGNMSREDIAREIAALMNEYFVNIGLSRTSFNITELQNEGSIFRIIMVYSGNLHENRRNFI